MGFNLPYRFVARSATVLDSLLTAVLETVFIFIITGQFLPSILHSNWFQVICCSILFVNVLKVTVAVKSRMKCLKFSSSEKWLNPSLVSFIILCFSISFCEEVFFVFNCFKFAKNQFRLIAIFYLVPKIVGILLFNKFLIELNERCDSARVCKHFVYQDEEASVSHRTPNQNVQSLNVIPIHILSGKRKIGGQNVHLPAALRRASASNHRSSFRRNSTSISSDNRRSFRRTSAHKSSAPSPSRHRQSSIRFSRQALTCQLLKTLASAHRSSSPLSYPSSNCQPFTLRTSSHQPSAPLYSAFQQSQPSIYESKTPPPTAPLYSFL